MKRPQHISFLQTFKTIEEAERFVGVIVGDAVILHLYHSPELQLFAVCQQSGADAINELLSTK